ncbi:glycosidase [Candidatus Saccharibacteria bacterium]|nr:glycosidase [Candidatus Saccharibacteria bacterium]
MEPSLSKRGSASRHHAYNAISVSLIVAFAAFSYAVTQAAGATVAREAEAGGPPSVGARVVADAAASGSAALSFGDPAVQPPPTAQGAWSSGATSEALADFATWRGRLLDNSGTWPNRETWAIISNPDIYGAVSALAGYEQIWIGAAMLPEQETASFAQCATGAYDQYFKTYGTNLTRINRGNAIIRLGWEANGDWYAWSIRDDVENYKACFRRQVAAIRSTAPGVRIDWNMNKESKMARSVAEAYPGDDVVDIIGVDFYDNWPAYPDKAAWDADFMSQQNGGPRGLGAWLAFAKAHGKKFSVPEWGLNNGTGGGTDNPYFMQAMYGFFAEHASDLAYETYFNLMAPGFIIYPAGVNPAGAAEYARLWKQSPRL